MRRPVRTRRCAVPVRDISRRSRTRWSGRRLWGLRGANLVWCSRHSTSRVAAVVTAHPNRRASVAISCRVGPAHPGAETKTSSSPNSGTDTRTGLSDRGRRPSPFLRCFCWARCCAPGSDELLEGSLSSLREILLGGKYVRVWLRWGGLRASAACPVGGCLQVLAAVGPGVR